MRCRILMVLVLILITTSPAGQGLERADLWRTEHGIAAPQPAARTWTPLRAADPRVQALADAVVWQDVLANIEWVVGLGNRYSTNVNFPAVADSLEARLAALGLETEQFPFTIGVSTVPNVIATQPGGAHADSVFVICAHFDATSDEFRVGMPGADDNATGTVAVLTAARLLAPLDLEYTVQYVLFGGEEQGLYGSRAWTAAEADRGAAIAGALNFDMIGWWQPGVPFDLEIETNAHSRWIADAVADCATTYAAMPYILHEAENITWGDFYAFWEQGFAAVNHEESWDWYDPDFNPNYHTTEDKIEYLDPDFTTGNVRVAVTALATLARIEGGVAAIPDVAAGSALRAYPDPFNGRTQLELVSPGFEGPAVAELYDVQGRLLNTVHLQAGGGRATFTLDAVDRQGRSLASGVYFVRVDLPTGPVTRRVTYVR